MTLSSTLSRVVLAGFVLAIPSLAVAQDRELAAENFQEADANGDRNLTYEEFVTFIDLNAADDLGNASMVSSRNMYQRAFNRMDANGDGLISVEELQAMQ